MNTFWVEVLVITGVTYSVPWTRVPSEHGNRQVEHPCCPPLAISSASEVAYYGLWSSLTFSSLHTTSLTQEASKGGRASGRIPSEGYLGGSRLPSWGVWADLGLWTVQGCELCRDAGGGISSGGPVPSRIPTAPSGARQDAGRRDVKPSRRPRLSRGCWCFVMGDVLTMDGIFFFFGDCNRARVRVLN